MDRQRTMLDNLRHELARQTEDVPPFAECTPGSPDAYNAISTVLLRHYYDAVDAIADQHGVEYHSNLGVLLFCDLHIAACEHYFKAYDASVGLPAFEPAGAGSRLGRSARSLRSALKLRIGGWLASRQPHPADLAARVAFAGSTTFRWPDLRRRLDARHIRLGALPPGRGSLPLFEAQLGHLEQWAAEAHLALSQTMGNMNHLPFTSGEVRSIAARLHSMSVTGKPDADLVVTGTLGALRTRAMALNALSHGVPVLTLHHGAQYGNFDEPYYGLYEGRLPSAKLIYGDIERQREAGTLDGERNLSGENILLFSRQDELTRRLSSDDPISGVDNLHGKCVLYFSTELESGRYGPFRDVHPRTYQGWQQQLIDWLASETGTPPGVRLHPKRRSTRFDPRGFVPADGPFADEIQKADVLVVDYPTTSLAHATASNKPLLFFDLGLRRMHAKALEALKCRAAYARVDVLAPQPGLRAMEAEVTKQLVDAYSPLFVASPTSEDELTAAGDAIAAALTHLP